MKVTKTRKADDSCEIPLRFTCKVLLTAWVTLQKITARENSYFFPLAKTECDRVSEISVHFCELGQHAEVLPRLAFMQYVCNHCIAFLESSPIHYTTVCGAFKGGCSTDTTLQHSSYDLLFANITSPKSEAFQGQSLCSLQGQTFDFCFQSVYLLHCSLLM